MLCFGSQVYNTRYVYMFFPTLGADSSAESNVNEAVESDDAPHEYMEVREVFTIITGDVIKVQPLHHFFILFFLIRF